MAAPRSSPAWEKLSEAAAAAAANCEALPIDDAVKELCREPGLDPPLTEQVKAGHFDSKRFARERLPEAVGAGLQESVLYRVQDLTLIRTKDLRTQAAKAEKALNALVRSNAFTLSALARLTSAACASQEKNSAGDFDPLVRQLGEATAARRIQQDLTTGLQELSFLTYWAKHRERGIAKQKRAAGNLFMKGFVLEMMKTYYWLTDRVPSDKRVEGGSPFIRFADAALNSVSLQDQFSSCAFVVRSTLPRFKHLHASGAFETVKHKMRYQGTDGGDWNSDFDNAALPSGTEDQIAGVKARVRNRED